MVPKGAKGAGEPFRTCPKCNSYVLLTDLFNEWELMTNEQKNNMKRRAVFTAVQIGGLLSGFGSFIALGQFFPQFLKQSSAIIISTCVFFFVLGSFVHYFFVKRGLDDEIEKSKKRMSDPKYRYTLQQLGLIKRH
jgi:hypothetical protein